MALPSNYWRMAVAAAAIIAATLMHMLTPAEYLFWHNVFQRLYYLPIVYAAIFFGWRGGISAALGSAVLYLPHIFMVWRHHHDYEINQYAEIILFFLVGGVTGILADRERQQREELARVNEELAASFEQLKRADRLSAIGQLAAGLAHEIRNPLASIEGATEILESPATPEDVRKEFLGIVRKESRRLNRLLTGLLDFARPRPPEYQEVDIGVLIDSVTSLVAPTAEKSGVRFRKRIAGRVPRVQSDPEQLKQVLLNITINAVQAMPEGGEIEFAVEQAGGEAVISIRDQGTGIAPEQMEKIFDPFFTTKDNGTGLGLSVAHRIVSQHGGKIEARRNDGRGTTFVVSLPLERRNS